MKDLPLKLSELKTTPIIFSSKREVKAEGETATILYKECLESDRCVLKSPFKWNLRSLASLVKTNEKSMQAACYDPPNKQVSHRKKVGSVESNAYEDVGFVQSWISPQTTMVDAIVKMTNRIHDSTVVISTMQWSVGQLERLKDHFKRRKINAFIIGDLGIWFDGGGRDTSFFSKLADSTFHILPAFRTPKHFFNSHHVKGAIALTQDGDYIFTSSNLTSGDGTVHKELGITGKSKKFSGDLLVAISDLVAEYCTERRYASCNLVKFGKADFAHELELEEMIAKTCKDFFKNETIKELYSKNTQATHLISARDYDVNKTVSYLMGTAKQSIRGTIHELRHIPIIKDFIANPLKDRKIFLGENADTYLSEAGYLQGSEVFLISQELPHAKAVLFDDRFLFWGSGNFTRTGFMSEREVYAIFTDRKVIEAYRKFYALFEKAR